jgi:hypothetical protein
LATRSSPERVLDSGRLAAEGGRRLGISVVTNDLYGLTRNGVIRISSVVRIPGA